MASVSIAEMVELGMSRDQIAKVRTGASQFLRGINDHEIDSAKFDSHPVLLGTATIAECCVCQSCRRVALLDFQSKVGATFQAVATVDAAPVFGMQDESVHLIAFYDSLTECQHGEDYLLGPLRNRPGRLFVLHGSVFFVYSDDTPEALNYFLHTRAKELPQCREFTSMPLTTPEPH